MLFPTLLRSANRLQISEILYQMTTVVLAAIAPSLMNSGTKLTGFVFSADHVNNAVVSRQILLDRVGRADVWASREHPW
jgi:hypothetical protein